MSTDWSEINRELRVDYKVFQSRTCIALQWAATAGVDVAEGDLLGSFIFEDGGSEEIRAPSPGRILRLFRPQIGTLEGRPAQVLALFHEGGGAARSTGDLQMPPGQTRRGARLVRAAESRKAPARKTKTKKKARAPR